jgi:hypothetical protein
MRVYLAGPIFQCEDHKGSEKAERCDSFTFSEGKLCHTGILFMHEDHSSCFATGGLSLLSDFSSQRIGQIYSLSLCELERPQGAGERKTISHRATH